MDDLCVDIRDCLHLNTDVVFKTVIKNIVLLVSIAFGFGLLAVTPVRAVSISNVQVNSTAVRVYEKYEVKFSVASTTEYPFFQYDESSPPGVLPRVGITVEGVFTSPSGKILRQPAFFMTEVTRSGSGSSVAYEETNIKYWVVRFAPQETGQYSVTLSARDSSGTTTATVGTFTAQSPVKPGFIRVSQSDPRYFEFNNGDLYWPIGPAWGSNYAQYKNTGQNLERPWVAGLGIYSTNWARWKSTAEQFGNEGIMTRLNWREKYPGHDLSYEIFYATSGVNGFEMWLTNWLDETFGPRLKSGRQYQVKLTYKATNIAGPSSRCSSCPYGFVIKINESHHWGISDVAGIENFLRNSTRIVNHISTNSDWNTVTTTFTSPINSSQIYLYLDNVTSGQVYVDEFSMREILPGGGLGGEVIGNPRADQHTYVENRPAAFMDWQLDQGEQNDVFFKYVVHDKNDWIQSHLLTDGVWADVGDGYYQAENTKARWLLRQWYRYLVARWGYSTAIHSWELNNEGPPNEVANGTAPHWETAQAFASYMHQIDAHPHLATTSFWCCWRPVFWGNNTKFGDIDYADVHEYSNNPQLANQNYTNDVAAWIRNMAGVIFQDNVGKPTILAENGLADSGWAPISELQQTNPGIYYHNQLWAGLDPGALFAPNYWYSEHLNRINRITISTPFYNFVKTLDLNKGGYVPLGATISNTKLRVFGQKNLTKRKAHAWIQNADHTWRNVMNGVNSSQSGTISFVMNPNAAYVVETWNTYTGSLTSSTSQSTNRTGTLTLTITSLSDDRAVKITPQGFVEPSPTPAPTPSATPAPVPGDVNHDGTVNGADLKLLLPNWLGSGSCSTFSCDLVTDAKINALDFGFIVSHWN